jgi:succinate dehydrogenase / fumarate reductase, cytochrome b subunit
MSWFSGFLTSSIGRKFVMAATGLFLISFLTIHCILNSLIFFNDHGLMFNTYAHFMGTNYIVHILEVGLFLGIILHIVQAYMLYAYNKQARPIGYEVNRPSANSKLYSRSMTLLGTLILIFLIIHLKDFLVDKSVGGTG